MDSQKTHPMLQMTAPSTPNIFYYKGGIERFEFKLNEVTSNPNIQIENIHVVLLDHQTKQPNYLCCILTGILGFLFLIPLVVLCCEWWNKMVETTFEIPVGVYQRLVGMLRQAQVRNVNIEVKDSAFGKKKSKLLFEGLSTSEVKEFTFYNSAATLNYNEKEYTDFEAHMKAIKMLPIKSYIRWYSNVVS